MQDNVERPSVNEDFEEDDMNENSAYMSPKKGSRRILEEEKKEV